MKLLFYDDFKLGALSGNTVVDLSGAVSDISHTSPQDLLNRLIEDFPRYRGRLEEVINRGSGVPVDQVRLRSPLPKPNNIVAMFLAARVFGKRAWKAGSPAV